MKRIAHVSDLHFGREDPLLVEALLGELERLRPTVVAVSGDLTQRAREEEFVAARAFLDRLGAPAVVVPGNHDVPLWNVARRFLRPLGRYRTFIGPEVDPFWADGALAVAGLNTARALTVSGGDVSDAQLRVLCERLGPLPPSTFRAVVAHHPFLPDDPATRAEARRMAARGPARRIVAALAACQVDLVLSGHLHRGHVMPLSPADDGTGRTFVVALAGTAVSTRVRGEPNAFNVIDVDGDTLSAAARVWDGRSFVAVAPARYVREQGHWREA